MVNSGVITGGQFGITTIGAGNGPVFGGSITVNNTNTGVITGGQFGIAAGGNIDLTNYGLVKGVQWSVYENSNNTSVQITNYGKIEGAILIQNNSTSASHIAIDLTKNAGIPSQTFNDAAEITCLANDFGYDNWIAQGIRLKAREADCLIAISSSGSSPNIANAARQARASKLSVVALSGMASDNPLRKLGNIDLWIDSRSYNLIEATHQFWLMSVVDLLIGGAVYRADREVQPKIHRNERPA